MRRALAATGWTFQAAQATRTSGGPARRLRAAIGALALAMACGGGDGDPVGTAPPADVVGTYRLQRIGNSMLPAVVERTTTRTIELISETLTLNADRTFTDVTDLRETTGATVRTVAQRATGTYTLNGNIVIFSYAPENAKATATYGAGGLSMVVGGISYQYSREP
jgi:hypothetical protein